jgi:outer membrane protein OmpA-like peptidoglycan-associated protein
MTVGLRARLYGGVTLDAGADIRLHGNSVAYAPPLPSYDIVAGASYALDVDSFRRPVVVTRVVEKAVAPPAPLEGRIAGVAKDKDGKGIGRAVVTVAGVPHGGVVTDADGSFETPALPPGPIIVEVSAHDFEPEKVTVAVTAGKTASVAVALTAKARTGNVRGKTTDAQGHAVEATLRFSGAQAYETRSDSGGLYSAALIPGPYRVVAEAPGLPSKESQLDVVADHDRQIDMTLRPLNPDLTVKDDEIVLRVPIAFKAGAPKIAPGQQAELDGVVALLEDRPDIRVLRIEAHWDATAGAKAKPMTDAQAAAVKAYLVGKGIPDARLETLGAGAERPLMPNITPAYRARNRRIELHIVR